MNTAQYIIFSVFYPFIHSGKRGVHSGKRGVYSGKRGVYSGKCPVYPGLCLIYLSKQFQNLG